MSSGKKVALGIVVLLVVLVVGLAIVIPMLIDIDRYRPRVTAYIQQETGKPAEIGRLSLTLFPSLAIQIDDFKLANPTGFPKGYVVQTRRIYAVVDGRALWNRQIVIKSLELNDPFISLLSDSRGKWNFESPEKPKPTPETPAAEPPMFTLGVISKVAIAGGQLTGANVASSGRASAAYFEARSVSSELEQVDLNAFIESASAAPAPSRMPAGGGWLISMMYAETPQQPKPVAQGTLRADSLRFGAYRVTAVRSKVRLFPKQIYFDDISFALYGGHASGNLSFNFAGKNVRYSTNARLTGVDVAGLLEAFPEARGQMTGKMEGNIKLSGEVTESPDPLAGMRGTGQVSIRDGELPRLQLNRNLMLLARLSNLGPASGDPSSFSSISADLNIANQRLTSQKINVIGNGVEVDGSGNVAPAGEGLLEYEGVAKVLAGQNPVTNILASFSGATFADGKLTFPFTLGGTFQKPKFSVKSAGGAGRLSGLQGILAGAKGQETAAQPGQTQPQTPAELVKGITGLFKKKQPTQQQTTPQQPAPQPK